jgi:hypothetical protein
METIQNQTDRFFRERLAGFGPDPDDKVWAKIAGQMARARRKKAVVLYFRIAAGMALLVSLGIGGLLVSRNNGTDKRMTMRTPMSAEHQNENENVNEKENEGKLVPLKPESLVARVDGGNASNENQYTASAKPVASVQQGTPVHQGTSVQPVNSMESNPALAGLPSRTYFLPVQSIPLQFVANPQIVPEQDIFNLADFTEPEEADPSQHAWIVGSEIAPLFSYRTIASDYLEQSAMKSMNQSEDGLFAYAGGISVGYSTGKRLRIESGVYYSRYGQEKNNLEAFTARYDNMNNGLASSSYISIPNSTGQIVPESSAQSSYDKVVSNTTGSTADLNNFSGFPGISTSYYTSSQASGLSATQYFDYLEVPLVLKYRVIDRKLGFSITGGLVTNFLVNDGLVLHNNGNDENLGKTSGINYVNYLGSVGLGIDYPIMNKVAFSLTPRFRYYLNPIDRSSQINVHPYSFGIFAGISYTFE